MATRDVPEEAVVTHAGIAIWGTLEARVQSADLVILGGLNEGIWPRLPGADPWSGADPPRDRPRQPGTADRALGARLPAGDGRAARGADPGTRDSEAPTVASRWLLRLENLLLGLGPEGEAALGAAKARGAGSSPTQRARRAGGPGSARAPAGPAAAGSGAPGRAAGHLSREAGARPLRRLRATVLRLYRLDPPGRRPDALTRGRRSTPRSTTRHRTTETGCRPTRPHSSARPCAAALAAHAPWPAVQRGLDRAPRPRRGVVPRQRSRPARARRPGGARTQGRREVEGLAQPFAITLGPTASTGAGRLRDIRLQVGREHPAAEARAFHLQLPLEAAIAAAGGFEGLPLPRRGTSSS